VTFKHRRSELYRVRTLKQNQTSITPINLELKIKFVFRT